MRRTLWNSPALDLGVIKNSDKRPTMILVFHQMTDLKFWNNKMQKALFTGSCILLLYRYRVAKNERPFEMLQELTMKLLHR